MSRANVAQSPGVYRRRVGDIIVTALTDGFLPSSVDALQRIHHDEARGFLDKDFLGPQPVIQVNVFAIQSGDRVALIDTGSGVQHMPESVGFLRPSLAAAGIDEASIDTILLTHIHPDHSYGLVDAENRAVYPNASVMMARQEHDFWLAPETDAGIPPQAMKYFHPAREAMAPYAERIELFTGEGELLPGVSSVPLHGHTPGHSGYRIDSNGESLFIWGDVVHMPSVQLRRPDAGVAFDIDGPQAAKTRARLLDQLASDPVPVAGMHIGFPGFAHVTRETEGYGLVIEPWRNWV